MHNLPTIIAVILLLHNVCVAPAGQSAGSTEYEQLYEKLVHLEVDESHVAPVIDFVLQRDAGSFHLKQGQFHACMPVDGRVVAAIFIGNGTFTMKPPTQIERDQLFRFYEQDSIDMEFKVLFLMFADSTWSELKRRLAFGPGAEGTANDEAEYCLKYLYDDDSRTFHEDFMWTFLHRQTNDLFYAHFGRQKLQPFFFQVNPFEPEEISFSQRGEGRWLTYAERITQFRPKKEYKGNYADEGPDKNLIRITDYRIDATVEENLDFSATTTLVFQSLCDSLRWIPFQLFGKLDVDTVAWNGQGARHVREEKSSNLWVQVPRPLGPGEVCSLTVHYSGELLKRDEIGWIRLQSSSLWYPRSGYRTRANFDLTFHTPTRWEFASVGKQVSTVRTGDTITTQWRTVRPTHNASFTIGTFKEIVIDAKENGPQEDTSLPNVRVLEFDYAPKGLGLSDLGDEVREDILNCMRFFQSVYGKSPVDDFCATETPYLHGEAFPGLIHLSWATYKYADSKGENEIFRAHEVAHQWWGVGVNFRNYHDQWISEGFSEYSGLWYMQTALRDNEKFFDALDKMREKILTNRKFLFGSGQESGPVWLGYRTHSSNTKGDYDLIVYKKGAWIIHMLRNMMIDLQSMNEDRFKGMMREFFTTYLGKEASTRDFQRVVEKHMGVGMDWFFSQWVMDTKIPEYEFSYNAVETPHGKYKTTCRVLQQNVPKEFVMPVPLLIKFDDGRLYRHRIIVSAEKQEYELPLFPFEPQEIVFNDLSSVLCEVNYEAWKEERR